MTGPPPFSKISSSDFRSSAGNPLSMPIRLPVAPPAERSRSRCLLSVSVAADALTSATLAATKCLASFTASSRNSLSAAGPGTASTAEQKVGGRRQRAKGRRRKEEGKRQKAKDRGQESETRSLVFRFFSAFILLPSAFLKPFL